MLEILGHLKVKGAFLDHPMCAHNLGEFDHDLVFLNLDWYCSYFVKKKYISKIKNLFLI